MAPLDLLSRGVGVPLTHANIVAFDVSMHIALLMEQLQRQENLAEHVKGHARTVVAAHPSKLRVLCEFVQTHATVGHHDFSNRITNPKA